jgi:hypothetical protein
MSISRSHVVAGCLALSLVTVAGPARADDGPPPNYVGAFVGTSLTYRPPGGPIDGPQGDVIVSLGYGRQYTPELAFELDATALFDTNRDFGALVFVPAVIYGFRPNVYAAMRFIIPTPFLDGTLSEWNLGLAPGLGVYKPGKLTPSLEANVVTFIGRGHPDFAVQLTAGAIYGF